MGRKSTRRAAAAISDLLSYDEHSRQARGRNAARRRAGMQARAQALRAADNELHKLVCYVDGEREIGEEDVAALTPYVPEANVFEMVDALANGNGGRALKLISQSLHDDPSDPGFRLFALIVRQFRLLAMTRDHLDRGGGAQGGAIVQGCRCIAFCGRTSWRRKRGDSRRRNWMRYSSVCKRYDQDMKTGRIAPRLALDLLVTSLASG